MTGRRKYGKPHNFFLRHRGAVEIVLLATVLSSLTVYLAIRQMENSGVVIGGLEYTFGGWNPARSLRYSIDVRTTEYNDRLLVYYYVPSTNGLNQEVLSDHVTYSVGQVAHSREMMSVGGDSVVVWSFENVPAGSDIKIGHIFEIQTRQFTSRPALAVPRDSAADQWLGVTELINSDDENVLSQAMRLRADSGWATAGNIYQWITSNFTYKSTTLARRSARDVLASRQGDCDDIAGLVVSLARAVQLPARVVIGTYGFAQYLPFHAYAEVDTEYGWVAVDASNGNGSVGGVTADYIRVFAEPNAPRMPSDLGLAGFYNTAAAGPLISIGYSGGTAPLVDWQVSVA